MGKLTLILMAFTASLLTMVSKVSVVALSWSEPPPDCLSTRFNPPDAYDIEPCIFPFKYNGVEYTSCTWASSEKTDYKPWCSTRVDSSGNHISGHWGNCESGCPIPSKTCFTRSGPSANKPCIFPFKFNGTEYSTCTYASSHSGEPWCSTEVDPNGNHLYGRYGKWGNCDDDCPTEYSAPFLEDEDDIDYRDYRDYYSDYRDYSDDQVIPAPPPYPSGQCSNGCEYDNLLKRCACWSD